MLSSASPLRGRHRARHRGWFDASRSAPAVTVLRDLGSACCVVPEDDGGRPRRRWHRTPTTFSGSTSAPDVAAGDDGRSQRGPARPAVDGADRIGAAARLLAELQLARDDGRRPPSSSARPISDCPPIRRCSPASPRSSTPIPPTSVSSCACPGSSIAVGRRRAARPPVGADLHRRAVDRVGADCLEEAGTGIDADRRRRFPTSGAGERGMPTYWRCPYRRRHGGEHSPTSRVGRRAPSIVLPEPFTFTLHRLLEHAAPADPQHRRPAAQRGRPRCARRSSPSTSQSTVTIPAPASPPMVEIPVECVTGRSRPKSTSCSRRGHRLGRACDPQGTGHAITGLSQVVTVAAVLVLALVVVQPLPTLQGPPPRRPMVGAAPPRRCRPAPRPNDSTARGARGGSRPVAS